MEIWKDIPNFSGYEASSCGRLRSKNYKRTSKKKILKPSLTGGYLKTMLKSDSGKYKSWTVHKFITLAFFGPSDGFEVNHKDGCKTNNNIENLEYCTRSENIKHSYIFGLKKAQRGSTNGNSKLTKEKVIAIREEVRARKERLGKYYGRKEVAEKFGISESHVKDIMSRRRGLWNYV